MKKEMGKMEWLVNFEPEQLLFWIFNLTYEKYLDKKLALIRNKLTSKNFWEFVLRKISGDLQD